MGTSRWAKIKSIDLQEERIGTFYMLNVFWHIEESLHKPKGNEGFQIVEHLTPDEALQLANVLEEWAESQKEQEIGYLKEIPEHIIKQRWGLDRIDKII